MLIEMIRTLTAVADKVESKKARLCDAKEVVERCAAELTKANVGDELTRLHLGVQLRDLLVLRRIASFVRELRAVVSGLEMFQEKTHAATVAANKPAHDKAEAERLRLEKAEAERLRLEKAIDDLKAKQQKELEALEKRQDLENALPVMPDSVMLSNPAPWASYKVEGLRGAVELFKQFPVIVPIHAGRSGCLSLEPVEIMKKCYADNLTGNVYAAVFSYEGGPDRHIPGASAKMYFYTRIDGKPIRVSVDIKGPDYIGMYQAFTPVCKVQRGFNNRIISQTFEPSKYGLMLGRPIIWASGDNGPVKTSYYHSFPIEADHWEDSAPGEMENFIDRMELVIKQLEEKPEPIEPVISEVYEQCRMGEYPLYGEKAAQLCPNSVYVGGISRHKCACDDPNHCPGVNYARAQCNHPSAEAE